MKSKCVLVLYFGKNYKKNLANNAIFSILLFKKKERKNFFNVTKK